MIKNRKNAIALACLLLVGAVGGAYAYWNQTETIKNPFDTGTYGSTLTEDFKPSDGGDWQPGSEVNKDVIVQNTGDRDLIVRVKMDETWTRKDGEDAYKTNTAATGNVYTESQANATDGLTAADKSVVTKIFSGSANWVDGGDGWYYYKTNLPGGQSTDLWLDAVTLRSDADMGSFESRYYVSVTDTADPDDYVWVEYTAWRTAHDGHMPKYYNPGTETFSDTEGDGFEDVLHNKAETTYVLDNQGDPLLGYSDSDYTLTITSETVQATRDAVVARFGLANAAALTTLMTSRGLNWDLK